MILLGKNKKFHLFGLKTARVTVYLLESYKPEQNKPRNLGFSDQQENLHNVQNAEFTSELILQLWPANSIS